MGYISNSTAFGGRKTWDHAYDTMYMLFGFSYILQVNMYVGRWEGGTWKPVVVIRSHLPYFSSAFSMKMTFLTPD